MNNFSLRFFAAILLLSASFGFAAEQEGAVIKIVSSLPRTGSARGQTDTIVNGIQMAIEESGHKVGAFTIKYEDLDDATAAEGQWPAWLSFGMETFAARSCRSDIDLTSGP